MNKYRLSLLTIILIALALRLYNLTYHSLWFDEAISVHWARQNVPRILEVGFTLVEDRLPPLYYLLLKGWSGIFGFGEASVRGLSVVFGVLLAPVTAGIATLLFNRRVALITAALIALNPFLIWYSQEARMYAPAVFFSALTVWAFLQICNPTIDKWQVASSKWQVANGQRPANKPISNLQSLIPSFHRKNKRSSFIIHHSSFIILFILSATAGLYSHLYTGFLLPALGLWLIISYPRAWRIWLIFAAGGVIITLAFAPIALAIWRFSGESTPGDPLTGLPQRAWWLLQSFTIWKAPLPPTLKIAIPVTTALFALLAYLKTPSPIINYQLSIINYQLPITKIPNPQTQKTNPKSKILLSLLLITPFAIASLLLLRNHLAFFGERYFIIMIPWLLMLVAVGADNLSQWILRFTLYVVQFTTYNSQFIIRHSPFIILLTLTALPIPGQWSIPATKETWRQSVDYLAQHAAPNHGILIHPDWMRYPFQYYFQGPGQTYAAFSNVTTNTTLDGPLQGVVDNHEVIWLIQSHLDAPDPDRLVEQWLATRYPLVTELYPPGIILKGYAPGYQLDSLPAAVEPVDIQFKNGMHLVGYKTEPVASATDELFHPPSGWLHVTLYWTAGRPIATDATPFVHLVGPEGVWGASLERPTDALKLYPPSRWSVASSIIRHDLDVNLNPDTPPGTYQLIVGLHGQQVQHSLTKVEIR